MKTYRKKLSKESLFYVYAIMLLIADVILLGFLYSKNFPNPYVSFSILLIMNIPSLLTFFQFNYVNIDDNALIIGNGIYTFLQKKIAYADISKVTIGQGRNYYSPYIQVFTHQKKTRKYMLILVYKEKLNDLVNDLQNRDIPVEFDLNK